MKASGNGWGRGQLTVAVMVGAFGAGLAPAASGTPCPTKECDPAILARRSLDAVRITGSPPVIDGRLDDAVWGEAPAATGFVCGTPRPAAPASLPSEARVLVDGQALYVALRYDDPAPAGIQAPLARRDDETTSDWAFVEIDSRYDRRTAFSFGVNPRGVQVDGLWLSDTEYETSWNGVWESAAHVDDHGWTAEFRIPFSQLAFSLPAGAAELTWGINFYRYSPSHGESSNWSPRYQGLAGIVTNFNDLRVPAPSRVHRLELTPYLAPRLGSDEGAGMQASLRGGADLKAGLGRDFRVTATVLPDFGQVEADPSQVNLTAFELFQAERRPFFLEGLDVFRLNTSLPFSTRGLSLAEESPFYSRRVGRAPRGEAPPGGILESVPATTRLLGAAKLSGQTASGWTLGIFTAMTGREQATLRAAESGVRNWPLEAPATLSLARAIKTFDRGESSLGFFVADLHRFDLGPVLAPLEARDAAAAGADLLHRFGGRQYELRTWALGSHLAGAAPAIRRVVESPHHYFQRPDGRRLDEGEPNGLGGVAGETRVSRVGGALRWNLVGRAVSPGFDVNEIGFQRSSDWLLVAGTWRYERFRPGHGIRAWAIGSGNLGLGWTWAGESRARVVDGYASIDTSRYWTVKLGAVHEMSALSLDWLRGGPAIALPPQTSLSLSVLTDQRKPSYLTLDASLGHEPGSGSSAFSVAPLLNLRSSDKLQWSVGSMYRTDTVGWQYVGRVDRGSGADFVVARVSQRTLSFTLRADLTFSPRLVLQAYVQPFATIGRYDGYQRLVSPRDPVSARRFAPLTRGAALPDPRAGVLDLDLDGDGAVDSRLTLPDGLGRSSNGSLVFRWEYRPGSFLTAVWNEQRQATSGDVADPLGGALKSLLRDRPTSVVLIKMSLRLGS